MAGARALTMPEADASSTGGPGGSRPLRRRRGLPRSRAVVGGLLVAAAAVGLFAAADGDSGPGHSYVVARRALAPGTRLQPADLALQPMQLPPTLRARVFDDRRALAGATLVSPLAAGELVQSSVVVAKRSEAASRELSFTVERGRVSPAIRDGERVDLLATYGTGADAFTVVVVRSVLVVSLDRSRGGLGDSSPTLVTVALDDPADAVAVAHAAQAGRITPVRTTGVPPVGSPPPPFRLPATPRP